MMLRSLSDADVSREALPHYEHLYAAIGDRDNEAAAMASRAHLQVSRQTNGAL
jgi:DNA-binding FadR family transcriptional regulator